MDFRNLKTLIESYLLEANLETLNRTYGVEFEMCFNREKLVEYANSHPDLFPSEWQRDNFANGNQDQWDTMLDAEGLQGWSHHYDGSVQGNSNGGSYTSDPGIEIVTPILSGEDGLYQIVHFLELAKKLGGYTNASCGGHVHIGAKDLLEGTEKQVANKIIFGLLTAKKFKPLLDAMIPSERRGNDYALDVEVDSADVAQSLNSASPEEKSGYEHVENLIRMFADSRYRAVNIRSLPKYGTIELRIFDGTVNYRTIEERIRFGVSFVNLLAETEVDLLPHLKTLKDSLSQALQKGPRTQETKGALRELINVNLSNKKQLMTAINRGLSYSERQETEIGMNVLKAVLNYPLYSKPTSLIDHEIAIDMKTRGNLNLAYRFLSDVSGIKYRVAGNIVYVLPVLSKVAYEARLNKIFYQQNDDILNHGASPEEFLAKLDQKEAAPYVIAYNAHKSSEEPNY